MILQYTDNINDYSTYDDDSDEGTVLTAPPAAVGS